MTVKKVLNEMLNELTQEVYPYARKVKAKRPDYELISYGKKRSTFKHDCGKTFEADNVTILKSSVNGFVANCPCQHVRAKKMNLEHLQQVHNKIDSNWVAIKYDESTGVATLKNRECGHTQVFYDLSNMGHVKVARCLKCFPNKFRTNGKTHDEYIAEIATTRPDYKVLGKYVSSITKLQYLHKPCKHRFETSPNWFQRSVFKCPGCGDH